MKRYHEITNLTIRGGIMSLFVDGKLYRVNLAQHSKKLATADSAKQKNVEISPSGYGLYWPEVDEDLAVDGLIGISHTYAKDNA